MPKVREGPEGVGKRLRREVLHDLQRPLLHLGREEERSWGTFWGSFGGFRALFEHLRKEVGVQRGGVVAERREGPERVGDRLW